VSGVSFGRFGTVACGPLVAHIETSAALVEALAVYRSAGWDEVPATSR
jgi:hypothetical protein